MSAMSRRRQGFSMHKVAELKRHLLPTRRAPSWVQRVYDQMPCVSWQRPAKPGTYTSNRSVGPRPISSMMSGVLLRGEPTLLSIGHIFIRGQVSSIAAPSELYRAMRRGVFVLLKVTHSRRASAPPYSGAPRHYRKAKRKRLWLLLGYNLLHRCRVN